MCIVACRFGLAISTISFCAISSLSTPLEAKALVISRGTVAYVQWNREAFYRGDLCKLLGVDATVIELGTMMVLHDERSKDCGSMALIPMITEDGLAGYIFANDSSYWTGNDLSRFRIPETYNPYHWNEFWSGFGTETYVPIVALRQEQDVQPDGRPDCAMARLSTDILYEAISHTAVRVTVKVPSDHTIECDVSTLHDDQLTVSLPLSSVKFIRIEPNDDLVFDGDRAQRSAEEANRRFLQYNRAFFHQSEVVTCEAERSKTTHERTSEIIAEFGINFPKIPLSTELSVKITKLVSKETEYGKDFGIRELFYYIEHLNEIERVKILKFCKDSEEFSIVEYDARPEGSVRIDMRQNQFTTFLRNPVRNTVAVACERDFWTAEREVARQGVNSLFRDEQAFIRTILISLWEPHRFPMGTEPCEDRYRAFHIAFARG